MFNNRLLLLVLSREPQFCSVSVSQSVSHSEIREQFSSPTLIIIIIIVSTHNSSRQQYHLAHEQRTVGPISSWKCTFPYARAATETLASKAHYRHHHRHPSLHRDRGWCWKNRQIVHHQPRCYAPVFATTVVLRMSALIEMNVGDFERWLLSRAGH